MNEVTSAGIVVYKMHDNKPLYLVMHYASGHWDFSKGHLEAGESSREAAIRELMEEAGITATIDPDFQASIQYIVQDYRSNQLSLKTVYFFTGIADSTLVVLSNEHQAFEWLSYDDARKKLTYDNAREILDKVNAYISVEFHQNRKSRD